MDVSQVEARVTPRTRAIMPVHIYGHPVDMDPILDIARRHVLAVVEDAAEAHGAEYKGRKCGSFGDLSCFSFFANKLVTTGEGGMVLTNREDYASRLRALRNLCFQSGRRFYHEELGFNFRLTNLQAALGVAQVERMGEIVARKRAMGQTYNRLLGNLPQLQLPAEESWARNVYWMYGVVLSEEAGLSASEFASRLAAQGVETRPFFLGMHEQPALRRLGHFAAERHLVAERLARQGFYLPSGLACTDEEQAQVAAAVRKALT
jgi:perosamine synthetase